MFYKFILVAFFATFYFNCNPEASPVRKFDMNALINKMYGAVDTNTTAIPELDWDHIKFKELTPEFKEISLTPAEIYEKIERCVDECLKDPKRGELGRDNCVAKHCDIY